MKSKLERAVQKASDILGIQEQNEEELSCSHHPDFLSHKNCDIYCSGCESIIHEG